MRGRAKPRKAKGFGQFHQWDLVAWLYGVAAFYQFWGGGLDSDPAIKRQASLNNVIEKNPMLLKAL